MRYDPATDHNTMFDLTPAQGGVAEVRAKSKSLPSVAMGKCPECASDRPIGIVPQGNHLVWRLHVRRTMSGVGLECPASGLRICDLPPVTLSGVTTPTCRCESRQ